jgi:hypothetical protein
LLNSRVLETPESPASFPWIFGGIGILALAVGLVFVIRPRQAGEAWWKITQGTRPYRAPKVPLGVSIGIGCLFLLIGAAMLWFAGAFLHQH